MTKKAIIEKYTQLLNQNLEDKAFYREQLDKTIAEHCTEQEIEELSLRKRVQLTLERIRTDCKSRFFNDWSFYTRTARECGLISEILDDLK